MLGWIALCTLLKGSLRLHAMDREAGMAEMHEGATLMRLHQQEIFMPLMMTLLAETEAEAGRPDAGLATIDTQLAAIERTGQRWYLAELLRAHGEILLKCRPRETTSAESAFMQAIDIARSQAAKAVRTASRREPRPALARPRQTLRSPRSARSDLRLVHRRFRCAGLEGREGAAGTSHVMSDVRGWLAGIGLGQYAGAFEANDVEIDLLKDVDDQVLKDIGVTSAGHRLRIRNAIAKLAPTSDVKENTNSAVAAPEVAAASGERRPLSVMFCDLIGSTALSSRLDAEDLREVIRTYQACVATTIRQFDGFIARYVGDGVLIYFGWPEARETDAERAVRAGLAVAAAVSAAPAGGEPLHVRIGIATGLVVIGEPIGSGDSRQQTAVGETPNLAARLQGLAGPNQVVIDAATRRQIGGLFECQGLGTVELKGLPVAVPAWQVLSENRTLGQFEALRSGATPLVGRDEEMELLLRRWAQAKAGNGRVVLISAEPGVGKSRLAAALAERIASEPHTRLRYFCSPHHQDSALYPVIAQMERAAGFRHADGPAARLAKLQTLLAPTAPPVEDVALIAELHSLPSVDLAPPLDVTPQRKKDKTFEALLRQVEGLSRQQPVLMIFDDLHWIDPSSRDLLDRVIEQVADWSVLLLAMFRPEFQPPWTGQPHVTMLTLARLNRRDTAAMVAKVAGDAALPPEIIEEIAERTDGVPLFVEELTKAVLEAGAQGAAALAAVPHPVGARDFACLADGAAGSAGIRRQGRCANRRGNRPRVRLCTAGTHHRSAGATTS